MENTTIYCGSGKTKNGKFGEFFKDVKDFEGLYMISNLGNVKSVERKVFHPITGIQIVKERILKPDLRKGYEYVSLCKNGIIKGFLVHRLVAFNFLNPIKDKNEVNHQKGIKTYNRVENLEWCNSSENQIHAVKMGLQSSGSNHKNSKLIEKDVLEIRDSDKSYRVLAKKYNVSISCIFSIKKFKSWNQIKK